MAQNEAFGRRQSPLVVDARNQRKAGRKPTSYWEVYWPFFVGFVLTALLFGALLVGLFVMISGNFAAQITMLVVVVPALLVGFLVFSLLLIRLFLSVRGGAETLGNVTFLSATNTGFKIGGLIGLAAFLWFTPVVFGDPFTGNPSARSSIVAQLILKALGFIGLFGMLGSRFENYVRPAKATASQIPQAEVSGKPMPAPALSAGLQKVIAKWPRLAAIALAVLSIIVGLIKLALATDSGTSSGLENAIIFGVIVFGVLFFYFKILDKIIRAMSRSYGFYVGVK